MQLRIEHRTTYRYADPVSYGLQQLRLTPKSRAGQQVLDWTIEIDGGRREVTYEDEHANIVDLISFDPGQQEITVTGRGHVEVEDRAGVVGRQKSLVPLWLYQRETDLTRPGPGLAALLETFSRGPDDLSTLHALSAHVLSRVPYSTAQQASDLTAEAAIEAGQAVCQDHAHIFVAAARSLGYPARYVSGYLMMNDRVLQDASHAWAEVHVSELGWVGFDVSNEISPDARYVRVATALDYRGAAPISGMRFGRGGEDLTVSLQVQQQ